MRRDPRHGTLPNARTLVSGHLNRCISHGYQRSRLGSGRGGTADATAAATPAGRRTAAPSGAHRARTRQPRHPAGASRREHEPVRLQPDAVPRRTGLGGDRARHHADRAGQAHRPDPAHARWAGTGLAADRAGRGAPQGQGDRLRAALRHVRRHADRAGRRPDRDVRTRRAGAGRSAGGRLSRRLGAAGGVAQGRQAHRGRHADPRRPGGNGHHPAAPRHRQLTGVVHARGHRRRRSRPAVARPMDARLPHHPR